MLPFKRSIHSTKLHSVQLFDVGYECRFVVNHVVNPVAICLQGIEIVTAEIVRNRVIIMDSHLKLTAHINHVFKVSMHHLRNKSKIRRYLTPEACKSLVHAFVTSRIDYCNSLLCGCNQSLIHRLQLIQNYAARLIVRIPKYSHMTPVLKDLH